MDNWPQLSQALAAVDSGCCSDAWAQDLQGRGLECAGGVTCKKVEAHTLEAPSQYPAYPAHAWNPYFLLGRSHVAPGVGGPEIRLLPWAVAESGDTES